jgi:hypothetical protein
VLKSQTLHPKSGVCPVQTVTGFLIEEFVRSQGVLPRGLAHLITFLMLPGLNTADLNIKTLGF